MITADQILAHLVGDYLLQSDYMASAKTRCSFAAAAHALAYAMPFILFRPSLAAYTLIVVTHFAIDRWRLARYVCFAKNFIAPPWLRPKWERCRQTGYDDTRPPFLSVWLLIIADNTLHLICNGIALRWL